MKANEEGRKISAGEALDIAQERASRHPQGRNEVDAGDHPCRHPGRHLLGREVADPVDRGDPGDHLRRPAGARSPGRKLTPHQRPLVGDSGPPRRRRPDPRHPRLPVGTAIAATVPAPIGTILSSLPNLISTPYPIVATVLIYFDRKARTAAA